MHSTRLNVNDESAMFALGEGLGAVLEAGDVVLLDGDLGAGKTTLARAIVRSRTDADEVPSPTYTLVQTYDAGEVEIWHADLYRLEAPEDVHPLGLMEVRDEVISLIEWPDRLAHLRPPDALSIAIAFGEEAQGRVLTFHMPEHSEWRTRLTGIFEP